MPHHPPLIGIRDRSLLELLHRPERLLDPWLHPLKELVREPHPADIEVESQLLVLVEPVDVTVPEVDRVLLDGPRLLLHRGRGGAGGVGGSGKVRDGLWRPGVAEANRGTDRQ